MARSNPTPIIALLLALALSAAVRAVPGEKTTQWIGTVLLGSEYNRKSLRCSRWVSSPTLSVIDADDAQRRTANEVVAHLNETLASTRIKRIRVVEPDDYDAKILVRFAPLADLPEVAGRHSISYTAGNMGYFFAYRNPAHQITRAVVLIASDKLEGDALRHFLLEEITQCLGPMNDSPIYRDSIFYSENFRPGDPTSLSERDKKLLLFLYRRVTPGANPASLLEAIKEHWQD